MYVDSKTDERAPRNEEMKIQCCIILLTFQNNHNNPPHFLSICLVDELS